MKNTRLNSILSSSLIACALSIGSLVSTQPASAQSSDTVAQVTIPFAFHTAMQTLPAGTYRIERESAYLIELKGADSKGSSFVLTHDVIQNKAPNHGSVVFERYGDTYYLRQVWTAGNNTGSECPKGRAEKASMKLAKNDQAPSTVELALNSVSPR